MVAEVGSGGRPEVEAESKVHGAGGDRGEYGDCRKDVLTHAPLTKPYRNIVHKFAMNLGSMPNDVASRVRGQQEKRFVGELERYAVLRGAAVE